jgi:hypothetical protein
MPAGISLIAVRGFLLSISLSAHLLNAIAALLAKTIHKITYKNFIQSIPSPIALVAKKKPIKAKGIAKIV